MSRYFCNGCVKYKESDIDGRHEMEDNIYLCDECECLQHEEEFQESMALIRKLVER